MLEGLQFVTFPLETAGEFFVFNLELADLHVFLSHLFLQIHDFLVVGPGREILVLGVADFEVFLPEFFLEFVVALSELLDFLALESADLVGLVDFPALDVDLHLELVLLEDCVFEVADLLVPLGDGGLQVLDFVLEVLDGADLPFQVVDFDPPLVVFLLDGLVLLLQILILLAAGIPLLL